MAGLVQAREKARLRLHKAMQVEAVYIYDEEVPRIVFVRRHTKAVETGEVKGSSLALAMTHEVQPKIIFLVSEVPRPRNGAIISVAAGEAYQIDNVLPAENVTIAAEVHRMSDKAALGLPVPGDMLVPPIFVLSDDKGFFLSDDDGVTAIQTDTF